MAWFNPAGNKQNRSPAAFYFGLLLLAYLLFIGVASFYLTDGITPQRAARAGAQELFFLAGEFRLRWRNLRDISTNILLYMPLGFLVALYLTSKYQSYRPGIHLWWGLILSVGVEITQAFIGRFSDATDVLTNASGYLVGYCIARVSVTRFGLNPASLLGLQSGDQIAALNSLAGLRFVYLAVVMVAALLPLDINVSVSQVFSKLQSSGDAMPRLILDPLYQLRHTPDWQYLTLHLLPFVPLAFLSSVIQLRRNQAAVLIPAFHCMLLAVAVESVNLFISSGRSDIIMPVLGFFAGLPVAALTDRFARVSAQSQGHAHQADVRYLQLTALLFYLLFLLAVSLSPYEFELSLRAIRDKVLNDTNLLPFRLHFSTRSIAAAIDIVRETLLYAPFGALLYAWLRTSIFLPSGTTALLLAGAGGFGLAAVIEALQLAVVGRFADFTDVLLATTGCVAGARLAPLLFAAVAPNARSRL